VNQITGKHILEALNQEYQPEIMLTLFFMIVSLLFNLAFTFSFQFMIQEVVAGNSQAYLLILLTMFLNVMENLWEHNYYI
jgi:hypothetical protein